MVKVFVSSVIDAPIEDVWRIVRGFNALPQWHPLIERSEIEGNLPEDALGCIRNFYMRSGENVREGLLAMSDLDHSFTYEMYDTGMGMHGYVSTLILKPVTDGQRTYVQWTADFTTDPGQETEKANLVANDVFQGGLDALKLRFSDHA